MTRSALLVALLLVATATHPIAQQDGNPQGRGRGGIRGQGPGPADPSQPPAGGRGRFGGPARDNQNAPTGSAKIAGRVVSADSGNPLRRAQVRLTAQEVRTNRVMSTDNDGRFEFAGLPAARYRLTVSKAGYVTLEYGQIRPFESGKPLDLADTQLLDKIDFSLPRGSVITGRITDEFGDPVADASVQAMRYQFADGQRQLVGVGRAATTDDIGQYRIFGLMPGDYIIRASVRETNLGALAMAARGANPSPAAEEPSGYPPTYFPGIADAAQAQTVTVALGQELNSIFFSLSPARLARVSGSAIDSQGRPVANAMVLLRAAGRNGGGPFNVGGANQVRADGGFTLNGIPPGDYTLDIQQRPRDLQSLGTAQLEFASIPLTVAGTDISGLTVVTTPGSTVSGHLIFQGQQAQNPSPRTVQIAATPAGGSQSLMGLAGRMLGGGRVNDDGSFQLRGLAGPQFIRLANVPAGWTLKSITMDGQDITDDAFDFKAGRELAGLTITLSDKITSLSGTVRDSRGQPVKDYVLVIFPEDNSLWTGQSRYIRTARPNQDGTYGIKGLPPGRYLAVPVESLETGTQNDPAVLELLKPKAKSFTLAEGQTVTVDLSFQP